jgi:lactate dehydrogenase-like 2-hydroxyacid dehydrogenase
LLNELRDYVWADTDEQQAVILETVYTRLGQPLPAEAVLPERVRLMTMHGAKGLSGTIAFIPALEDTILPGTKRAPYPGLVLEAARLLYVSITRARAVCIMSNAQRRFFNGKTAGIIGTGKIGRVVAEILRGFGMKVLAYDPFPAPDWAAKAGVEYSDPKKLARESAVISLHVPLTPETHHIVSRETIELTKPGTIIVNVSRGALIDTKALIEALKSGHLGGVALDVYEEEEGVFFEDLSGQVLQDDDLARLLTFPNVLITAHQAFLTREALAEIARVTVENLRAFGQGKPFLAGTSLT